MIVLLHGVGAGGGYFRPLADELGQEAVISELREPLSIPELAERVAGVVERRATVVAHSAGCQVAVEVAVRHPELVEALVLVGPTVDPRARSLLRHATRVAADAWYEPPRLNWLVLRGYLSTGPLVTLRQARQALAHSVEELLPRIEQPAVVVRGAHDRVCPAEWAREAASLLPNGRLLTIAGAAHAAHYSHPREVADVLRRLRA